MSSHDALLAAVLDSPETLDFLSSTYAVRSADAETVTRSVAASANASALVTPIAPRAKAKLASKGSKDKGATPAKPGIMPEAGTIDAASFLVTLRTAGIRQATEIVEQIDAETGEVRAVEALKFSKRGTPVMIHDAKIARLDERTAISAFMGYDLAEAHGSQLDRARGIANATISRMARVASGTTLGTPRYRDPGAHQERWSVPGYVAGLPKPFQKLLTDLEARERLAASDLANFDNLRTFAKTGARREYDSLLKREYGDVVRQVRAVVQEVVSKPEGQDDLPEVRLEQVGYVCVDVENPVHAALKDLAFGGEALNLRLAQFEALAQARLDAIREDLASLGEAPTVEQIERISTVLAQRGAPTIEEEISIQHTTPRA